MARSLLLLVALWLGLSAPLGADDRLEFFEKKIRPALIQHCYKCHSAEADELKGGLRVDSRDGLRRGGESGPAVVPGKLDESYLLAALAHDDSFVNMPPSGKLPSTVIADFRQWIATGAVDPRDQPAAGKLDWQQTLAGRKQWWSLQPVRKLAVPEVRDPSWPSGPIDRFLQHAWEDAQLSPAASADPATLLRRLTYVVTGLPPTPAEVDAFVQTVERDRGTAIAQAVDRLLASPRFGEHWARHWMDLVRYGETHGSEHDPVVPHAWRYRDYLIRVFNDDVPYDRFVHEQLAGDLLPPRWNRSLGINESLLGTMFHRMVEFYPTPVDPKSEEINVIDSQIDMFSKTFQAQTISCARCHDHKFDAISARDFYALYGIFASTRTTMHRLDDPAALHQHDAAIATRLSHARRELIRLWRANPVRWRERVAAVVAQKSGQPPLDKLPEQAGEIDRDRFALEQAEKNFGSPLFLIAQHVAALRAPADKPAAVRWQQQHLDWQQRQRTHSLHNHERYQIYADFSRGLQRDWFQSQASFPAAEAGSIALAGAGSSFVTGIYPRGQYSHLLSDKHGGTLRSPNFVLDMNFVSALVAGTNNARFRLVVENFQGDGVLYVRSTPKLNGGGLNWVSIPIRPQWKGRRAYVEIMPRDEMTYVGQLSDAQSLPRDGRSGAGIRYVVFHNEQGWPNVDPLFGETAWTQSASLDLALQYVQEQTVAALDALEKNRADDRQAQWLDGLLRAGWLANQAPEEHPATQAVRAYRDVEARVPVPQRAPGVVDEASFDEQLYPRGDYRQASETVERRYLEAFASHPYRPQGSGRLELAQELTSAANPLTARVYVNRVWHHVFGAGLVRSVDNFGQLGEQPSHPELLDWLAASFIEQGWSTKRLLRELLVSRTFQLASVESPDTKRRDPDNRYWSRASLRRLEAEAIRDSLLAVSGRMSCAMYGPGVPIPVPKGYKDFDVPKSGPLDGDGRRSVYLEARRNYPLGLLMAFDQPRPMLSVGRREVTNVPAQSLAMLNDPLVWQQAERLAERVLNEASASDDERVGSLMRYCLGRSPTSDELRRAETFLHEQSQIYNPGGPADVVDRQAWRDLAHALFNRKEFIFLR